MLLTDTLYLNGEPCRLWIEVNPETVSLDCNNVQKAPLSIRFWMGEGSEKTALAAFLTLKVESVVGSSVTTLYTYVSPAAVNSYSYTIPSNSYATANRISVYAYEDAARKKEIAGKQVNIVVENPVPFPRSEAWATGLVYKNGEYLLLEDVIYMWGSRVPGNTTVSPKADLSSATPSGKWKSYQNWPLLATNIALIKFGLIGSAVFKDEFMYSQQGTNAAGAATNDYTQFGTDAFAPNFMINFLLGKVNASLGLIGGWNILKDGIESEELSQSNNGVTGKSKTILKKDGTILGNLLNVALGGGKIRSSLWDAPIMEWGDRVVKIRGILSTPFELISAIIQPSGNPYFGNVYTTNLADKTNCILLEPSYPSSGTSNNYASKVYYRLPANINHSGVTFRFFNPATRTQGWRACTAVLGYNISLDDSASWIGSSGKTPFLGNCMADELLIPPGKMVVITGVREQVDGGSFGDDKLKWYVEVTA